MFFSFANLVTFLKSLTLLLILSFHKEISYVNGEISQNSFRFFITHPTGFILMDIIQGESGKRKDGRADRVSFFNEIGRKNLLSRPTFQFIFVYKIAL